MFVSLNPTLPIPWWPICLVPRRSPSPHSCSSCCCSDGLHRVSCRWSRPVLSLSCPGFSDASGRGAPRNLLGPQASADQKCEHWRNTVDARGAGVNGQTRRSSRGRPDSTPLLPGSSFHIAILHASLGSSPRFLAPTCLSQACFLGRPSKDSNVIFITLNLKALSCFRKTTCTHRSETSGNKKDTLKPSHALSHSGPLVVAGANWRACGPHGKAAPQGPWQALCDGEWGNGKASLRRAALGQRLSQLQRLSARLGVAAARPLMGWTSGARGDFSSPHRPTAPQQL